MANMKSAQKQVAVAAAETSSSRYAELKDMLDERRREIHAEVQGKMRGVREEGSWGGKLNEVLDAVESEVAALIDQAVEVARAAPPPDIDALMRDVYVSY